jgi:4-methylaminobutanoate oxidase (formaldehyde-forming)
MQGGSTVSGATLPGHAQVVIIGGGVMGCSTAYHLAKQGCDDVVLLERGKLTNGTTWHSAAMVRQLRSTVSLTQLTKYSARLYASLAEETGQETGWRQCGSISIATTPDRLTHIRRQASLARAFGVEAYEIGVDEIAGMWPFANLDDVIGGVYSPDDGRVNPTDLCAALVKGAKAGGARIFEDTAVTEILVSDGRITGVRTPAGDVHCEKVVLCGGLWSRELARKIGVSVPLHACEHYALVTRAVDQVRLSMPILGDHDNHMYIRDEAGGLLVGCFEPNARPVDLSDLPNDFSFDLLKEDWDHFEPVMLNVLKRIPLLEHAEVRTLINGPESFTPDNNFLLGETPEVRGLYVGCGMNSVGMASGGGAGYALAAWVIDDAPPMDLWSVDIRRFGNFRNNVRTLRQRAAESLSKHYAIAYPGREPETARNLRVTPLYPRQVAAGAHFGERSGWERPSFFVPDASRPNLELKFGKPGWFDLVAEEHRAARERVALFDQSTLGKLLVQGRDALSFLQRICANDVDAGANRLVYTPMLNDRGGYESDVVVLRLDEESFLVATGAAQPVRDLHRLKRLREDNEAVTVCDVTSAYAVIGVMGPRSRDLMKRLSDDSFSNDDFPFLSHREIEVGNTVARALRVSYVGELGWEIYVPSDAALPLYDEIRAAGEDFGVRDAGTFALGSLRTEKGFCSWGHDIGPDDTPLEAGMGFAVKLDKQIPFIGRDALLQQKEEGIGKRRVMIQLADPEVHLQGSEPIVANDAVIGHTTSAAYGHTLGASVAMGYIRLNGAKAREVVESASFEVEVAGERMPAKASLQAFFDPSSERMRVDDPVV